MGDIFVLSSETIDKIAAGEVVERPVNVVKELVENSIDANASIIHVEIKGGGSELIRVTDNGDGIKADDVKTAFLRHATSKLRSIDDFDTLLSMGFRGEALSSICAVSKAEMITKTSDELMGTHISIDGGRLSEFDSIGAPDGTTVIIRNLFYNTPARKKFLKSVSSESAMIEDLMEKLSLSHPGIAFQFTMNGKLRIQTNGSGNLSDCIYRIYGKDIYDKLLPISYKHEVIEVSGFLCRPEYSVSTRAEEFCFVNSRYIQSKVVSMAIEEGYKGYVMQHRFPFCIINIKTNPSLVDVNVHPRKMEVRFSDNELIANVITKAVNEALKKPELISKVTLDSDVSAKITFEEIESTDVVNEKEEYSVNVAEPSFKPVNDIPVKKESFEPFETKRIEEINNSKSFEPVPEITYEQEDLFEHKLISDKPLKEYNIIGQVFDTYWLITLNDSLYIVDQHAAHEKVNYEQFVSYYNSLEEVPSQAVCPSVSLHLSAKEALALTENIDVFTKIGFEIEDFGMNSFAIRAVPTNLYGVSVDELFVALLNEIMEKETVKTPTVVLEKIASMSCKAAVKGGNRLSFEEMKELMNKLMKLDNPYHCPHGRPVFIEITKTELEKKFKRIV